MLHVSTNTNRAEKFEPQCAILQHRKAVVEERGIAQCIGPQCEVHCCGPLSPGMQQLLACAFGEDADGVLGDAILKVCVYATEGKLMARVVTCFLVGVVGESPIVTVVVVDFGTVFGSERLKGTFGGDGFDRQVIDLGVHIS